MPQPLPPSRPLFGPRGRIPVATAVALPRPGGFGAYRQGWAVRHTLAAVLMAPLLFLAYGGAAQRLGVGWQLVVAIAALMGAVLLATYLPLRGLPREAASPCLAMPAAMVLAAGVMLTAPATAFTATVALLALGFGLFQRVFVPSSC